MVERVHWKTTYQKRVHRVQRWQKHFDRRGQVNRTSVKSFPRSLHQPTPLTGITQRRRRVSHCDAQNSQRRPYCFIRMHARRRYKGISSPTLAFLFARATVPGVARIFLFFNLVRGG